MREYVYTFIRSNYYTDNLSSSDAFDENEQVRLIIKPDKIIYIIEATIKGGVRFYDNEMNLLFEAPEAEKSYKEFSFRMEGNIPHVLFGHIELIDYYPHCDGEYDRWGESWDIERTVSYDPFAKKGNVC